MEDNWPDTWKEGEPLEGHLARQLAWWLRFVSPRDDAGPIHRFLVLMRGSKVALAGNVIWLAVGFLIIGLADNMTSAQPGVMYLWCALCALPQIWLLALNMPALQLCLRALITAAENIERHADASSKARLERVARWDRRRALTYVTIFLPTPLLVQFDLDAIDWVRPYPYRRWAVGLTVGTAFSSALMAYYLVLPLTFTLGTAMSEMHRVIGRALEMGPATTRLAALQSQLLRASLHTKVVIPIMIPCVVVGNVILPVFGMAELVVNFRNIDWLSLIGTPTLLSNFIPVCEIGDSLMRSRASVVTQAYRGPWLEETPRQRAMRLCIMSVSAGRGAMMRGRAVGRMNRRTCLSVLKTWFSYVQTMLQIRA